MVNFKKCTLKHENLKSKTPNINNYLSLWIMKSGWDQNTIYCSQVINNAVYSGDCYFYYFCCSLDSLLLLLGTWVEVITMTMSEFDSPLGRVIWEMPQSRSMGWIGESVSGWGISKFDISSSISGSSSMASIDNEAAGMASKSINKEDVPLLVLFVTSIFSSLLWSTDNSIFCIVSLVNRKTLKWSSLN